MSDHPHGYFLNKTGYRCDFHHRVYRWLIFPKVIYRFELDLGKPMMYYDPTVQAYIQPNRVYLTDKGSVPWIGQAFIPRDLYERPFLFHDSEYTFGGLWAADHALGPFRFIKTSRGIADERLKRMVIADGGSPTHANIIYCAVRVGGAPGWVKGDLGKPRRVT